MAARRFGAETAERLAALLSGIADADHLTEAGDWLVRCGPRRAADAPDRHAHVDLSIRGALDVWWANVVFGLQALGKEVAMDTLGKVHGRRG